MIVPTTTKAAFARILADELHLTKQQALQCVDAVFAGLRESVLQGKRIEIRGFGAWKVKETKHKPNARNPKTNAVIAVPARKKVMFKPGKELREALSKPL